MDIFVAIAIVFVFSAVVSLIIKTIVKKKIRNYGRFPYYGIVRIIFMWARTYSKSVTEILGHFYKYCGRTHWVLGPGTDFFFTGDLHLIKQICVKNFQSFPNRLLFPLVGDTILDNTIIFLQNPKWKICRSAMTPIFTSSKLKQMHSQIEMCIRTLTESLKNLSDQDQAVNIKEIFDHFTLEVIAVSAFDCSMVDQRELQEEFLFHSLRIINQFNNGNLLVAHYFPWVFTRLGFEMFNRNSVRYFYELIKSTFEKRSSNDQKIYLNGKVDLIELMMKHHREITTKESSEKMVSLEEITANCISFLMAGFETTSSALCAIIFLLAKHPSYQDRLYEEIVTQENKNYTGTKDMPFLEAIISESLRLYPPVPFIARTADKDSVIDDLHFPKGTIVIIPVCAIHRDPEYFSNPEEFYPERFLDGSYNVDAFMPFGIGPRNCIGSYFGLMEIRSTIVQCVKSFRFITTQEEIQIKSGSPLLVPKKVVVKIEKRENGAHINRVALDIERQEN